MKTLVSDFPTEHSSDLKLKGFKVQRSNIPRSEVTTFGRRHFYKIVLSIGHVKVNYADRLIDLDGVYLFFANPHIPYSVEILSERQTGYSCVLTDDFIKPLERSVSLQQSPLFTVSGTPVFRLNDEQQARISSLFETMIAESKTDYSYKDDLMRTYIQLLIHEALHMKPEEHFIQFTSASLRITTRFLELLEGQFPVENAYAPLRLKTAHDYADRLAIHVNYLNRTVKDVTGKSTTTHIAERMTTEAITLLQHTDWSVADIAFSLGFDSPNYFSNFFRKMTGDTPRAYRVQ